MLPVTGSGSEGDVEQSGEVPKHVRNQYSLKHEPTQASTVTKSLQTAGFWTDTYSKLELHTQTKYNCEIQVTMQQFHDN